VACRTAQELGADGVLALAFPLHPPGRPDRDRGGELLLPAVPRLVVQGERDAFGVPAASAGVEVHVVAGADHGFRVRRLDGRTARDVRVEVEQAVRAWLAQTLT
jgi:predicted alpha/beta-hydrolase family hydrolase